MANDIPETLYEIKLCTEEVPREGKLDIYINEDGTIKEEESFDIHMKTLKK